MAPGSAVEVKEAQRGSISNWHRMHHRRDQADLPGIKLASRASAVLAPLEAQMPTGQTRSVPMQQALEEKLNLKGAWVP